MKLPVHAAMEQRIFSRRADGWPLTEWYLDLKREGGDGPRDKILTIEYQPLEDRRPTGVFQILAEWEWGEKQIVRSILEKGVLEPSADFTPVGNRLNSGISLLMDKAEWYGLRKFTIEDVRRFWSTKPMVDLSTVLAAVNGGMALREEGPSLVANWYREAQYTEIIEYVTKEKDGLLSLLRELPALLAPGAGRQETPPR